ncbi:WXG100 family type VII secretion target [Micromonospora rubida]|uniref:WXG100 family type VII secretion target n=1 Tax=Micromonospora rubida TaxID=2697657 RepID=A0ABW7SJD9_9ACTN
MANYSINPAAAADVVQELVAVTRRLESSLNTLMDSVQRFTAANDGQAPTTYAAAQGQWNQGQGEMQAALLVGQDRLQEIIHAYVSGDNRGAAVFGG